MRYLLQRSVKSIEPSMIGLQQKVCGSCGDFKVIVNQPAAEHDAWKEAKYAPEEEFIAKLGAIEGITRVETQEFTMEAL